MRVHHLVCFTAPVNAFRKTQSLPPQYQLIIDLMFNNDQRIYAFQSFTLFSFKMDSKAAMYLGCETIKRIYETFFVK
jgi:hypothetical protein